MTDSPEISVVIPTRNRWPFLSTGALRSALEQEHVDHEVIVVDDGSSDDTAVRLAEVKDSRLAVVRHVHPRGVAAARNAGIARARGGWVAFLDDDDLWSPHKLRTQVDAAVAAHASFVYSDIVVVDQQRRVLYELTAPDAEGLEAKLLVRNVIPGGPSNIVAESSLVRHLAGFDEQLSMSADWDLWLRLSRAGRGVRRAGILAATAAHTTNMPMRTSWGELMRDLRLFKNKHSSNGLAMDEARISRWLALQRARDGRRLDPAYRLLSLAVRHGKPRYAAQAAGLLVPRSLPPPPESPSEPNWLAAFQGDDGR